MVHFTFKEISKSWILSSPIKLYKKITLKSLSWLRSLNKHYFRHMQNHVPQLNFS